MTDSCRLVHASKAHLLRKELPTMENLCLASIAVRDGESQVVPGYTRPGVRWFILGDLWKGKREQACGEVKGSCRRVDPGSGPPFPQTLRAKWVAQRNAAEGLLREAERASPPRGTQAAAQGPPAPDRPGLTVFPASDPDLDTFRPPFGVATANRFDLRGQEVFDLTGGAPDEPAGFHHPVEIE